MVLPLTMGLLVAATGFFALSMSRRLHVVYGVFSATTTTQLSQLEWQLAAVVLIAVVLAFGIAIGVTMPLREFATRLEAIKSGDMRSILDNRSTADVEWLAGAFNDALSSVNRYLLQGMSGAVITLNSEGRIIGASPAAEMVLGYREDEVLGKRLSDVLAAVGPSRAEVAAVESAVARHEFVGVDETYIQTKDGRKIRVGISVSYLQKAGEGDGRDELEEVVGVTIGFKDQSDIRELRDRLRKADQLLALGTMTAGVAHELRNPLASMRGLTELLGRDFAHEDPRRRYVSTMLEAIDRLNGLVENLLLLSSDAGPAREHVDLARLVREVNTFVGLGLGDRRVHLETSVEPDAEPVRVLCNRSRLMQALSNVVLNAVQATPEGGAVTVGVGCHHGRVRVRVHNTGSYIPPDVAKRLFVPFFTTKPTGTGLGLAIARHVVTATGGEVYVESDPDRGTAFTIDLPLTEGGSAVQAAGVMSAPALTKTA
ncbi:MAG: ATP-binding protein [Acidobacteriota bacterium]